MALAVPNAEDAISAELVQRSITHHIFRLEKKYAHRGRVLTKYPPAFPRYIFVPQHRAWEVCNTIVGVTDVLRMGEVEAQVSDAVVMEMISRCPNGDDVLPELPSDVDSSTNFKFGDRVRVVGDRNLVFGSTGIFKERLASGKALVLLPWFNGMTQTTVDEVDLEKISSVSRSRGRNKHRHRRRKRNEEKRSAIASE